jgi:hypothetical protein
VTTGGRHAAVHVGRARRIAALVVLAAGFGGLVFLNESVDRRADPSAATAEEVAADGTIVAGAAEVADLASVAPPATAAGSTWYCAGGTADDDGAFDHSVTIANPAPAAVTATVTVFPGAIDGDVEAEAAADLAVVRSEDVEVPAFGVVSVRVGDILSTSFGGALVEVDGGQVAVEHGVESDTDFGHAPCASAPSETWYLATGATTRDAQELLVLFNPFPDDAVADITFATTDGARAPEEYEGLVVPAAQVLVLDLGPTIGRFAEVATTVQTRSGRLVVDRLQRFDGSDGPAGSEVTLASTHPATLWSWPEGFVTGGLTESVSVYNPSDRQAEVDVEVILDDPATNGAVEPFALSVPPHGIGEVVLSGNERIPDGIGHSLIVRAQNGVPVLAERWERSGSPAPRAGFAATVGSPLVATQWLVAAGSTANGFAEFLVVANPSSSDSAAFSVRALVSGQLLPIDGLDAVRVLPSGRVAIDLGTRVNRPALALIVESDLPVIVERGLYRGASGFSQTIAVPTADHASIPAP